MRNSFLLIIALALPKVCPQLLAQNPPVNCDTVPVVAQAAGGFVTCTSVSATLTGLLHPSALEFHWTGPGGLDTIERVVEWYFPGNYTLTVTGKYGCTAQTSATIADSCIFYPLYPPECPNPFIPPAENCNTVCVRSMLPTDYWFSNADALNGMQFFNDCFIETHNDQWFAFVAGATAGSITAESANCTDGNGVQLALLEECGGTVLACNGGFQGGANQQITLTVSDLVIGKVYYLLVDGFEGDRCEYKFFVEGDLCNGTGSSGGNPKLYGVSKVCPGAIVQYQIGSSPFATAFLWTAPPGSLINGMPGPVVLYSPNGTNVTIEFGSQPGAVTVRSLNYFRKPSPPLIIPITMMPIPPTQLPLKKVCYEDLPFTWDEVPFPTLNAPGTYHLSSNPYKTNIGCDSAVKQTIVVGSPKVSNIGMIIRCSGDCFYFNGSDFCSSGVYSEVLESWEGCDSTVIFNLIVLNPAAEITGGGILNCATTSITLGSAPGNGVKRWLNGSGQVVGLGNTLTVTTPGIYILTNTITASGVNCIHADTLVIEQDIAPAQAFADHPDTLTCTAPAINLSGSASPASAALLWSGPDGFSSTEANPQVAVPGIYTLTATGPNGCSGTATVTVKADQAAPMAVAAGGTVTCTQLNITLSGASNDPDAAYEWTGPNGFHSQELNPVVTDAGIYVLLVTAPNGCTGTATATVTAELDPPPVTVFADTLDCTNTAANLYAIVADGPDFLFQWTGPNGFLSNLQNPKAPEAGLYLLTVTNAVNGCTAQAQVMVVANLDIPGIDVEQWPPACGDSLLYLDASSPLPGAQFFWTGPNGFTANTEDVQVTVADWYRVEVKAPNGCSSEIQILAVPAPAVPQVSIYPQEPVLTCAMPVVNLTAAADVAGCTFVWSAPSFPQPGIYTVTATTPAGCTGTAQVTVTQDTDAPTLSAEGGVLTCEQPTILITAYTTTPGAVITWYGPGFPINQNPVLVSEPGEYTAVATAPNGCISSVTVMVVDSCLVGTAEPINGRNIIIYPNPGSGIVYVKSMSGAPVSAVALHRIDGALIYRETVSQVGDLVRFDWSNLPAGVYVIAVLAGDRWVDKPLILLE